MKKWDWVGPAGSDRNIVREADERSCCWEERISTGFQARPGPRGGSYYPGYILLGIDPTSSGAAVPSIY